MNMSLYNGQCFADMLIHYKIIWKKPEDLTSEKLLFFIKKAKEISTDTNFWPMKWPETQKIGISQLLLVIHIHI